MTHAVEEHLLDAAAHEIDGAAGLGRAYRELSDGYRSGAPTPAGDGPTAAHVQAYLAARLPATYAVSVHVLEALAAVRPDWAPGSVLDLGAGPGTATWAAAAVFGSLTGATLVEHAGEMVAAGRRMAARSAHAAVREADWIRGGVAVPPVRADLVIASYVLGELASHSADQVVDRWWAATAGELVVVEPGTPAGAARILGVRERLLAAGATISAPCPSDAACPLTGEGWCHFAERVGRTAAHRAIKDGELGFEDEKFSYLCVSRRPPAHAAARVLHQPQVRSGHVRLTVCAAPATREIVVSKRHKAAYRWARKAAWGDAVPGDVAGGSDRPIGQVTAADLLRATDPGGPRPGPR